MLKQIESLIEEISEKTSDKIEVPNSIIILNALIILQKIEEAVNVYEGHIYTCGNEVIIEWHSKNWKDSKPTERAICSIMISPSNRYICSYSGKENEMHEFDKHERLIEQTLYYLKQDLFIE